MINLPFTRLLNISEFDKNLSLYPLDKMPLRLVTLELFITPVLFLK